MSAADFDIPTIDRIREGFRAHPEKLDLLTPAQRVQAAVDIMGAYDAVYAKDCWRWLREQVWTIDEASQVSARWPDKDYLHDMVRVIDGEQMIAFPKSRRMMATWLLAAWAVHKARYFPNFAIFWQSLNEDRAAWAIDQRCKYIEDNIQPEPYRRSYASIKTSGGYVGKMTYRLTGSSIRAVPQGADALRSFTPSVLVMDESEQQPEAHAALTAAIPFVEKGAKLVLIGTSNGPLGVMAGIAKEIGFTSYSVSA